MQRIEVREATASDIDRIEEAMPTGGSRFHERRFLRQEKGSAVYLVAWRGDDPVGHLLLKWHGADEVIVHRHLGDVPEMNAIGVRADLRGHGIGSELISAAEDLARRHGFQRVGLAVGIENEGAHRLYRHLGYRDWPHGTFFARWTETAPNGAKREASEEVIYMTKTLS